MVNIAEILKNMPKGFRLYSPICGECKLVGVVNNFIKIEDRDEYIRNFLPDGKMNVNGECLLFPSKENRDWNTFRPFKDGDIIYVKSKNVCGIEVISIYKKENSGRLYAYCSVPLGGKYFYPENINGLIYINDIDISRFATEDEKIKLFDAIKANGYKWNPETKTLEKLIVPKFKVGDKIKEKNERFPSTRTIDNYVEGIGYYTTIHDWVRIEDQDNWELVPTHKFKVGERIIRNNTLYPILTVTFVNDMIYTVKSNISGEEHDIGVKIVENCYKIAAFSPYDLKPFDKILVKSWGRWCISHFGYFDNGIVYTENEKWYKENVLPYNDETKHLLGTCDDYDGFYKWW